MPMNLLNIIKSIPKSIRMIANELGSSGRFIILTKFDHDLKSIKSTPNSRRTVLMTYLKYDINFS